MRLLLDTHLVLWGAELSDRLPPSAKTLMEHPDSTLFFSVVSLWEVIIKSAKRRDDFAVDPGLLRRVLLDAGWLELEVIATHAFALASLPPIHNDPFDRMLIAQANVEGALLLTSDKTVARYPGPIRLV